MIAAVKLRTREQASPTLGLCLGMQLMVVEVARRRCAGLPEAHSAGVRRRRPHTPSSTSCPTSATIIDMGGTMRLGIYPCRHGAGHHRLPGPTTPRKVQERHRHRLELNNDYRERLEDAGLRFSGLSPDGRLVEIAEASDHPFMVGTQFHPEFRSRPNRPHPLFRDFIGAARHVVREGMQPPLPLNTPELEGEPVEG